MLAIMSRGGLRKGQKCVVRPLPDVPTANFGHDTGSPRSSPVSKNINRINGCSHPPRVTHARLFRRYQMQF
jgi:hypothetical protein